jgi:glucosylceramidase
MGFTPELQRDFIKTDLGPALNNSAYKNVALMILDDQRFMLPKWAQVVLSDPEAAKFVSHIAVHWYGDKYTPVQVLDQTHEQFPDYSLFGTEACTGEAAKGGQRVELGNWKRGESYAHDILETLNNWYTGWTDWNLALNLQGGPNWVGNFVDSPIIVNSSSGEFYKQPMFYAMGHFSAFLPRDSVRVGLVSNLSGFFDRRNVMATGFVNANGYKVVILLNKYPKAINVVLAEKFGTVILPINVPASSFQTIIWK